MALNFWGRDVVAFGLTPAKGRRANTVPCRGAGGERHGVRSRAGLSVINQSVIRMEDRTGCFFSFFSCNRGRFLRPLEPGAGRCSCGIPAPAPRLLPLRMLRRRRIQSPEIIAIISVFRQFPAPPRRSRQRFVAFPPPSPLQNSPFAVFAAPVLNFGRRRKSGALWVLRCVSVPASGLGSLCFAAALFDRRLAEEIFRLATGKKLQAGVPSGVPSGVPPSPARRRG